MTELVVIAGPARNVFGPACCSGEDSVPVVYQDLFEKARPGIRVIGGKGLGGGLVLDIDDHNRSAHLPVVVEKRAGGEKPVAETFQIGDMVGTIFLANRQMAFFVSAMDHEEHGLFLLVVLGVHFLYS
jgi:hypothetical protein